jgi:cysteine desulfurase
MGAPPIRPAGLHQGPIYLDYNATTPVDPRVVDVMIPYQSTHFGNPSSTHAYGRIPHDAVISARRHVAELVGTGFENIVFTGSGSEANLLAIRGCVLARRDRGNHIITQRTEHPSVLETCRSLQRLHGFTISTLTVDATGRVDAAELESLLTPQTVLVTVMHANNETGTLQPIADLAAVAHRRNVLFHTDAAQSVGKIPTRVAELGVDMMTIVGHKIYAPKGVGALYVRPGLALEPVNYGGGQERGLRAGTENTAQLVGIGEAARLLHSCHPSPGAEISDLRDLLQQRLEELLPGRVHLNGHPAQRLPNTLNVSIDGVDANQLLAAAPEIAASTGSACHATSVDPSAVLLAMGHSPERALAAIRLSLGRWTTRDEIEAAAAAIASAARRTSA